MSENIIRMNKIEKKASTVQRLGAWVAKKRIALLVVLCLLVLGVIGYAVGLTIHENIVKKDLDKIELIEFSLTKDASDLEDSVITEKMDTALSNVEPYLSKGGIVGARADMLAADIYMYRKYWSKARELLADAANKRAKTYIASICNFNAAVCSEELGENDKAIEYYTKVCDDKEFVDRSRAYFSVGRINESIGNYDGAKNAYEAIASLGLSNDTWNDLAQTRLIALKAENKIQ